MSEAKFTKGEWVAIKSHDLATFENCVKMVDSKKTKYDANIYACIGGFDSFTQSEEVSANAHLIAAAPEMYKALIQIQIEGGLSVARHKSITKLLAKARGENESRTRVGN